MKNRKVPNFFLLVIAVILGSAIYKDFDFENLRFNNIGLVSIYIGTLCLSLYFLIKDYGKDSDVDDSESIWITNYEGNEIKITNKWFGGEKLFVNNILQDKKFNIVTSELTGYIINSNSEKENIKVSLFGWFKIRCKLFINDNEVEVVQEK